jgi:hypothetical protein
VKRQFWRATGVILLRIVFIAAMAGCGSAPTLSFSAAERTQIDSAARQAAATFTLQIATAFGPDRTVTVTATVGWTAEISIGDVAQEQERVKTICFEEQRALWTSGIQLQRVNVIVLGPVQDDYADMILDAHARADLTAPTAAALHWAALDPDTGWERYDSVWLRATYQPHVVGS